MECIDALKASMPLQQYKGFLRGNVFKYLWRHNLKKNDNGAEDLGKAQWYLNKLINEVENENKKAKKLKQKSR
tara:strand:+ start:374 stop:592 length:219 start_codon:yes stop_codon:yes gene_type:complete